MSPVKIRRITYNEITKKNVCYRAKIISWTIIAKRWPITYC